MAPHLHGNKLAFSVAVAVRPEGIDDAQYGSFNGECKLEVDKDEGIAYCSDIHITNVHYPEHTEKENEFKQMLNEEIENRTFEVSTERLLASLRVAQITKQRRNQKFKFNAPKIYISKEPTALVSIDGKPVMRSLDENLMRVINTPFVLLFDQSSGTYYLRTGSKWREATDLNGRWKHAEVLPLAIQKLEKQNSQETGENFAQGKIIVTTEPTSLIQINREPEFTTIENTDLLYVSNTENHVFLQIKTQHYFTLLSGRWYTAKTLDNYTTWKHISAKDLPKSFSKIPEESDKSIVLVSVPGTTDAEEALIQNEIPTTATVNKKNTTLDVTYDGEPIFEKIEGTSLEFAVNTDKAVIRYNKQYYANHDGVWFFSNSAKGPWAVAELVPDEIYDIPPSNPLHRVTYNYVYETDDENVYVGYTPGYQGSYSYDDTVIYGTGYYNPGWVGNVYYAHPQTWGYGFVYDPYYGWYSDVYWASPFWFGLGLTVGYWGNRIWYDNHYYYRHYKKHGHHRRDAYRR